MSKPPKPRRPLTPRRIGYELLARAGWPAREVPLLIERALAAAGRGEAGPFVPFPLAERHFGRALEIAVAPDAIGTRLRKWRAEAGRQIFLADDFLDNGSWELSIVPLAKAFVTAECRDLARWREAFRSAPSYARARAAIERGEAVLRQQRRLRTIAALDGYYRRHLDLLRSIERDGLRRVGRLERLRGERDIGVAIDADGALHLFGGGLHRAGFAQALGLDRMPVLVRFVHLAWLARRMAATGLGARDAVVSGIAGLAS